MLAIFVFLNRLPAVIVHHSPPDRRLMGLFYGFSFNVPYFVYEQRGEGCGGLKNGLGSRTIRRAV